VGAGIIHEFKKKNTADIMSGGFTLPLEHKVDQTGLELQGGVSFNDGGRFSVLATSSARIHRDTVEYGGKITANVRF
jgi:hypothetical protein